MATQPNQAAVAAAAAAKNDKEKYLPKIHTWDECDHVQVFTKSTSAFVHGN